MVIGVTELLFGDSLKWLLIGILGLLVLFVLVQIFYRYLVILAKKIKAAMLGHEPRTSPDLAQKYSHAHDPAMLKRRAMEDQLLPKYGNKKTEHMLTKLINKKQHTKK